MTAGCTMLSPGHSCFQSSAPSAGATLDRPVAVQQHDLRHAVDCRPDAASCSPRRSSGPNQRGSPGGDVVGSELAGGGDDHEIADDER